MGEWQEKIIPSGDRTFLNEGEQRVTPLVSCHGRLEIDDRRGRTKVAAAEEALEAAAKITPVAGRVYILNVALGSFEFWGDNNNGDAFPEAGLLGLPPADVPMSFFDRLAARMKGKDWGHKTFLNGHTFEEHRNTDPSLAIGGIAGTYWNDRMHRCENILWIDRKKGAKWATRIDAGEPVGTSMACKIPFDRCSRCGNLAVTRVSYCQHLKPGINSQNRHILADGLRVCMMNDFPWFFDDSMVENPAAPEALTLMKIASAPAVPAKRAELTKDTPDLPSDVMADEEALALYDAEQRLPIEALAKLAGLGLPSILEASERLGMALRPSEVFALHFGLKYASDDTIDLDRLAVRRPVRYDDVDLSALKSAGQPLAPSWDFRKVARAQALLAPFAPSRSYLPEHLVGRLVRLAKSAARLSPPIMSERADSQLAIYHALCKLASGRVGVARPNAAAITRLLAEGPA